MKTRRSSSISSKKSVNFAVDLEDRQRSRSPTGGDEPSYDDEVEKFNEFIELHKDQSGLVGNRFDPEMVKDSSLVRFLWRRKCDYDREGLTYDNEMAEYDINEWKKFPAVQREGVEVARADKAYKLVYGRNYDHDRETGLLMCSKETMNIEPNIAAGQNNALNVQEYPNL